MRRLALAALGLSLPFVALGACTSSDGGAPAALDGGGLDFDSSSSTGDGAVAADDSGIDAHASDATSPDSGPGTGESDSGSRDGGGDVTLVDSATPDTGVDSNVADSNAADSAIADGSDASGPDAGVGAIRVGNLWPDGAPIDFCVIAGGTSFASATPYLKSVGLSAGLAYAQLSELVAAPDPGTYVIRIVAAGASGCGSALSGLADVTVPTPTVANPATIALFGMAGDAADPLTLHAYVDEGASTAPSQGLRLRIVHAAPGAPATSFEIGAGPTWTSTLQTALTYGQTSNAGAAATGAPTPDANGYLTSSIDSAQITATVAGGDVTSGYDEEYRTASAFYVGSPTSATSPLGMLLCDDTHAASGHLSACTLRTGAPTFSKLRWLNVAPGSPAVTACLQVGLTGPLVDALAGAGIAGGESFLQLTGQIVTYPDWTSVNTFFAPVGDDCADSVNNGSIGTSLQGSVATVTLAESVFGATPTYNLLITGEDFDDPNVSAGNGLAGIAVVNDTEGVMEETIDVYDTPAGGAEASFALDLGPRDSTLGELGAALYGLRVADHTSMTNVFQASSVTLAAGTTTSFHFFTLTATTRALAACDPTEPAAGKLTTCTQ